MNLVIGNVRVAILKEFVIATAGHALLAKKQELINYRQTVAQDAKMLQLLILHAKNVPQEYLLKIL